MPWTVQRNPDLCSEDMPWAVIRLSNGEVEGCHASESAANAQLAALYAQEEEPEDEEEFGMLAAVPSAPSALAHPDGLAADDLHVTLRYLGDVRGMDMLQRRGLHEVGREAAASCSPFEARIAGAGYLGDEGAAVLFLEHESLEALRACVDERLDGTVEPRSHPHFVPHLTVGYGTQLTRGYVEDMMGRTVRLGAVRVALGDRRADYPLTMPMNMTTYTTSGTLTFTLGTNTFSTGGNTTRGATPTHHTEVMQGTWDAGMHVRRLPSPMSTSVANRMFGWYDSSKVSDGKVNKADCKLPHHSVSEDGSPGAAIMNGVRNALSRLPQTDLPASDRAVVERHLRAHLEDGGGGEDGDESNENGEVVEVTFTRDEAEHRLVAPPPTQVRVSKRASRDLRKLPEEVLKRIQEADDGDVGVVDRVGRGLFEMRFTPEIRFNADGSVFLHGYGTVYDYPYEVMGGPPFGWVETITRGACLRSIQHGADVRLLVNHEGIALARTKSNTLRLESDDIGLYCCAPSLDYRSPTVQSLVSAMERGDMDEMSFAFRAIEQEWNEDYSERQISEVRLYDVSVVTYPANPATVTTLRAEDDLGVEAASAGGRLVPGLSLNLARAQAEALDRHR